MRYNQKKAKSPVKGKNCGFLPLIFRAFRTLHFLKRYVLSKILIKKKAFYFSKRALRAGKLRNKWLKKALSFKIFFIQSILLFFAKCLSKKCMNDNKSKLRVHRRVTCNCLLSTNWMTFLRCNKIRLNYSLIYQI